MSDSADFSLVAVIGLAGRFPGASTVEQFWDNLCRGVESVSRVPEADDPAQPAFRAAYGVLDRADEFDADFFGYAPAEALIIDPQQRVFLECAQEALERAGYAMPTGRPTVGVFAGGATTDYRSVVTAHLDRLPMVDEWQLRLATAPDFLATRVAHKLRLEGPAIAVQTACSTSLVAVHVAIQALLAGDCEIALAGGATVHVPHPVIRYTEGGIISPDGRTRAFDASAEGGVGGSAAAVVVLRPLADALANGDHIHAVVRGSAVNNDGGDKIGFTAPSVDGQARTIRAAHLIADVDPDTVTYVEAHGTGTRLGDPIEIAALTKAFRAGTDRRGFCAVGSVKTNIGHTDAAAGVVGLIKAVLAVEHGIVPPSLHFERPNPDLGLDESPFVIADELRTWQPAGGTPRRAGVSSLGVGGTNAHVVVEQPPAADRPGPAAHQQLLALSARTPEALDMVGERLAEHLRGHPDLDIADVAWTLRVGRPAYRYRRAVVVSDTAQAVAALGGAQPPPADAEPARGGAGPSVVFMFPGQGGQHVGMAAELYEQEPAFRDAFDECAGFAAAPLGLDLRAVVYPAPQNARAARAAAGRLATIAVGQPAVFAVEYALANLLESWGIRPDAVVGHSLGAYAAACVAGVLPLRDAVRLVVRRGQLLQSLPAGAMLAVRLPEAETEPLLPAGISVAAVNGPAQCTVAGPAERVRALADELTGRGIDARVLPIATAGHSTLVEPIVSRFRDHVAELSPRPPAIAVLSDTTGAWAAPDDLARPEYWATHLRAPVQFGRALSTLSEGPARTLLEVGPGRTLVTLARQHPEAARHAALQTLRHPLDDVSELGTLYTSVGRLWSTGYPVDWGRFDGGRPRRRVVLPTYPFQRKRFLVSRTGPPAAGAAVTEPAAVPSPRTGAESSGAPAPGAVGGDPAVVQELLRSAFADALGLDTFGPGDDFFDAGGDSLIATKLAAWARGRFGVSVTAADIIRGRTVAACACLITERMAAQNHQAQGAPAG
jgi:acyl transferase domain-containing protein